MKKFKLYSGIGLLLAFIILGMYSSCAERYGLWTKESFYATIILFVSVFLGILFLCFCAWLIGKGLESDYE